MQTAELAGPEAGEFGALLCSCRIGNDMTQETLSQATGLSAKTISNLERSQSVPRRATVDLLVEALKLEAPMAAAFRAAARAKRLAKAMK